MHNIIGFKNKPELEGLSEIAVSESGMFEAGKDGVKRILVPGDKKCEFISYNDKTLCYVKSAMGAPAIYPLADPEYCGKAKALLMDLDGTSVKSEHFWMWIIEQSMARLIGKPRFQLEAADEPHVSGHSVSEHLQYCIDKYCPGKPLSEARTHYFDVTEYEMNEILEGRGKDGAFTPAENLKEFLYEVKGKGIKIGLVTSGLYNKAFPEILSAFKTLNMGDPLEFYDCIITAGFALKKGQCGTLGELAPKPHPWLYSETAKIGLGLTDDNKNAILGVEDSSAGIISIRLAGYTAIGLTDGNIQKSGVQSLCNKEIDKLEELLKII